MKLLSTAVLGILLVVGTDAAAAALSTPEPAPLPTTPAYRIPEGSGVSNLFKRKKRRVKPAYRRAMRRR